MNTPQKLVLAIAAGLGAAALTKKQSVSFFEAVAEDLNVNPSSFGDYGAAKKKYLSELISGAGASSNQSSGLNGFSNGLSGFNSSTSDFNTWLPPASAEPYLSLLNNAEIVHGLPENLLVRVAYQESRFRDDIISGETKSSAGAEGIMQIVPRWHPDVDPLNVADAINYAASYLAKLKASTGSWRNALAAYNWGPGNLRSKGFAAAPLETRNYVSQIAGDVLGGYA